ncbi:MAG: M56 family metallopeptidase [Flavobacteriales bacterium]|nr:MAG: M56 family metallopeptidase [Flavobacteriales bacterium]
MTPAILWYLKANAALALLLGAYWLALRYETWLAGRRAWLLGAAISALLLPLLPPFPLPAATVLQDLPVLRLAPAFAQKAPAIDAASLLVTLHALVSVALIARLGWRIRRATRALAHGLGGASSFFGRIHIPDGASVRDRAAMLAHERAHAALGHSCDVVALELLAAACWSSPLWRILLRELRRVHEYQADAIAARSTDHYPELLLASALGVPSEALLNRFRTSNLQHRIRMLHNNRPPRKALPKLLIALPLVPLLALLTGTSRIPAGIPPPSAVVLQADRQAEFPGGMEALVKHLSAAIAYPESARKDGVEGMVHIAFTVQASGRVAGAHVKHGVRDDLDREAVRVVSAMPEWKPALINGKAVDTELTLPIAFRLGAKP